jgi:beta-lactamase superfamily II metal-dependent hydrolase
MLEIDFLPVAGTDGEGTTKSGDAITAQFTDATGRQRVLVIDAGFQSTGEAVVEHIRRYYGTDHVDLVISTHPDADHLNGLATVVQELYVDELLIHQPRQHTGGNLAAFSNLAAVDNLLVVAADNDTVVSDPFTGTERLGGHVRVLGPDKDFYDDLLAEQLSSVTEAARNFGLSAQLRARARNLLDTALDWLPNVETLTDNGDTSARNETSVVTLLTVDGQRILFTGDAGQRALTRVADEYESQVGDFSTYPLQLLQVPHHGSRRNLGPTLLDRILGPKWQGYTDTSAIVSAAKDAPKHPSPKVTNALQRRGAVVAVTAERTLCHRSDLTSPRSGWRPVAPVPPLAEGDDLDD